MKTQTPWGTSQGEVELAEGIKSYHTASHGGIRLSKKRQEELAYDKNWLHDPEWWEEDCDWAVPYVFFANEIGKSGKAAYHIENLTAALKTVEHYHPEFHARILGR